MDAIVNNNAPLIHIKLVYYTLISYFPSYFVRLSEPYLRISGEGVATLKYLTHYPVLSLGIFAFMVLIAYYFSTL